MSRRDSVIMDIEIEDESEEEIDYVVEYEQAEIEGEIDLERKELEDFENTEVNESEFIERL